MPEQVKEAAMLAGKAVAAIQALEAHQAAEEAENKPHFCNYQKGAINRKFYKPSVQDNLTQMGDAHE